MLSAISPAEECSARLACSSTRSSVWALSSHITCVATSPRRMLSLCEIFELRAGMAQRGDRHYRAVPVGSGMNGGDGMRGREMIGACRLRLQVAKAIERGAKLDPLGLQC